MTTKQILLSALILGTIGNIGLAMDQEDFKKNPTLYYSTNPTEEITCVINEEFIIFIKKVKKQDDGSCYSSKSPLDEVNEALKNHSTQPMTTKELHSSDITGHFTTSECHCNGLFIIKRKKNNPDKLNELLKQPETNITTN